MLDLTSYMTLRDSHNSEPPLFFLIIKKKIKIVTTSLKSTITKVTNVNAMDVYLSFSLLTFSSLA